MNRHFRTLLCLLVAASLAGAALAQNPAAAGGCAPEGDATKSKERALNVLKARTDPPTDDDVDDTADMSALLEPGDDTLRWSSDTAVEITAFVMDVRDGGPASSNCHSSNPADHDTILDLSPSANAFDAGHRIVAVITPQGRRIMAGNGVDWSTNAIQAAYTRHYVTVRGWLLFNTAAAGRSLNSAPLARNGITRATAWEIHPVTSLALDTDSLEQQQLVPSTESP
jgi:hypothetical protein